MTIVAQEISANGPMNGPAMALVGVERSKIELTQFCQDHGVTLRVSYSATGESPIGWIAELKFYSGINELPVGSPIPGRNEVLEARGLGDSFEAALLRLRTSIGSQELCAHTMDGCRAFGRIPDIAGN